MKNQDLVFLNEQLPNCAKLKGLKLSYAVAKNFAKVTSEMKILNNAVKKLQEEHAVKVKGEPKIEHNTYVMKDREKFNKAYKELMEFEIELKLHNIKLSELPPDNKQNPEENISGEQMAVIMKFLDEDEKKK